MEKVFVNLGAASYEIFIGTNILGGVDKFISGKALLVTQKNIFELCAENFPYEVAIIPDGETSKNLREAEKLYTRAIEAGLDRKSAVIALGGGVVLKVAEKFRVANHAVFDDLAETRFNFAVG